MARGARKKNSDASKNANGATLGFEEKLWQAADKLRGALDAAEYKHVVLGLIFLKYISDAFEERRRTLATLCAEPKSEYFVNDPAQRDATLEDRDEYIAANVFWVPEEARWGNLQKSAKQPDIATRLDDAMFAIERENLRLKEVLPRAYARPGIRPPQGPDETQLLCRKATGRIAPDAQADGGL